MRVLLKTLGDTQRLAQKLAPFLCAEDALLLSGDLGAGKTCFARALLQGLGVTGEVPSPTFTLVQSYDVARFTVFHFDLYRLNDPEEIEEIGFDEACIDGLVIVEWPEKAKSYMPRGSLTLHFELCEDGARFVEIDAPAKWQDRLDGIDVSN